MGREGLSPAIVFVEIGGGGETINNGIGNVLVIPLLRWNGKDIEDKEGDRNRLNVRESRQIADFVCGLSQNQSNIIWKCLSRVHTCNLFMNNRRTSSIDASSRFCRQMCTKS